MQEFWATASMNDNVMEFNIDNTPRFLELETFRDLFQVSIRTDDTEFDAPPSESETISFIKSLGYKGDMTRISHFEMSHLYQPWKAVMIMINKCLSGKSTGLDVIRLSRAQLL